ncbi:hypothetical protein AAHC03_05788 [Spirometra sp. Aus1]
MTEVKELTCGVCKDFFRNPYLLPCGHSFCRRPCLLSTPSSNFGKCIYCHIAVHESELEQNDELDKRTQTYLAERGNQGSRRVVCHLCRNLHDHCETCPHCDRQLCDLCFREHVDELQQRLKRKFQVLRDAADSLKQAREALASRRASGSRGGELSKGIDAATIALKSACESAFLKAETRLNSIGLRTKDRRFPALDKGHLIELAAKLLRTVNSPMQRKGILGLCKLRNAALNAVNALAVSSRLASGYGHPAICDLTMADNLQSLGAKLDSMNLLVDERSVVSDSDPATNTCGNPLKAGGSHDSQSAVNSTSFKRLTGTNNKQNISMKPQLSVPKFETPTQTTSTQTRLTQWLQKKQQELKGQRQESTKRSKSTMATASTPRQRQCENQGTPSGRATSAKTTTRQQQASQQQIGLEVRRPASTPRRALTLRLTGLKATISRNDLVTHFGRFGEVLSVHMHRNLSTNMHTGSGNIVLWPTTNPDRILAMGHTIRDVRINVSRGTHPTVWVLDQYGEFLRGDFGSL